MLPGLDMDEFQERHEINVTPFIDVMLVLLIIFMVAAPLATVDIPVDLPSASARQAQASNSAPLYLTITAEQQLLLQEQPVGEAALIGQLHQLTGEDLQQRIFLRADRQTDYDTLLQIINRLREAGYLKVGLVGSEVGADSGPGSNAE